MPVCFLKGREHGCYWVGILKLSIVLRKRLKALIFGIGTDIIEVSRLQKAIERLGGRFLERVFTGTERDYCSTRYLTGQCYAARFAAKEAVLKALGTGLRGNRWLDVEIISTAGGRPEVKLHGNALTFSKEKGIERVLVSLSHDRGRAVAFAIAVTGVFK